MEEYFRFKYYQEVYGVVFVALVIITLILIYFIGTIIDKIKFNKRFKKKKRRGNNENKI